MDGHSAELLELPAIIARVAGSCAFEGGRELARALVPSPDAGEVASRAETTGEALALLEAGVGGPGDVADVRGQARAAGRGATLDGETLDETRHTLRAVLELRGALAEHAEPAPGLAALTAALDHAALGAAADLLERSVGAGGQVLDSASAELAGVRRALARAQEAARALLRDLARDLAEHLQERFTTQRAGRPVLAVRASARSAVPGLVHDRSKSGETLFVEPFALVEASNRTAELVAEERAEVERVLAMLSKRVGELQGEIAAAVDAMARVDLALALARASRSWSGVPVAVGDDVALEAARHPLLDPARAVPITMDLSGLRALVVSGPNTGGKTVALKTLGLLTLMHQCGLRVPARSARLPVFRRVLADIGDEQSIARSLSTFSAHVAAMGRILSEAGPGTLVLLDEVAAGTDPAEGAALAQAVMEGMVERGALVVATTHHGELKEWASATAVAANAAVGVDPGTYAPTYELRIGAPGASHALAIAARLGLPSEVLARARSALAPGRRAAEDLLEEAARDRAQAEAERGRAERERGEAEAARQVAEARAEELERRMVGSAERAAREREAARAELEAELAGATRELTALRQEIARARREERRRAGGGDAEAERERDRRLGAADQAAERVRAALADARRGPAGPVRVGDRVIDAVLGLRGRVDAIEGEQAVVIAPSGRMRLPLARLAADPSAPREASAPAPRVEVRVGAQEARPEVDVRGRRADEARQMARDHVDRAALAGLAAVRVIHGRGTGALRAAVRQEMERHPLVERFEPAPPERGGDGATLVYLDAEAAET